MQNLNFQRLNSPQMRRDAAKDHLRFGFKLAMALGCAVIFSGLVSYDPIARLADHAIEAQDR